MNFGPPPLSVAKFLKSPSYRRYLLDTILEKEQVCLKGVVVDLGGKTINRRGFFAPSKLNVTEWVVVNIDPSTEPTIVGDVRKTTFADKSVDSILCCEVLEHVQYPELCVKEISRILKPGGKALITVPFLYPIHADPHDHTRWTIEGLKNLFLHERLEIAETIAMGSILGVLGLFVEVAGEHLVDKRFHRRFLKKFFKVLGRTLCLVEIVFYKNHIFRPSNVFTTGYCLVIQVPK
jgi:SAM-dependent methyltransferase